MPTGQTFEQWIAEQEAAGTFHHGSDGKIYRKGALWDYPLSTADLQKFYNQSQAQSGAGGGSPQGQLRGDELQLIGQLQERASGKGGPSVADLQLQKATDANMRQAFGYGAASQAQGLGAPAALRNVNESRANIQQESAGQSAQLRNQEQVQAQLELAQMLGGARGQDIQAEEAANQLAFQKQQAQQQMMMRLIGGLGQAAAGYATMGGGGAAGATGAGAMGGGGYGGPYGGGYSTPGWTSGGGAVAGGTRPDAWGQNLSGPPSSGAGDWGSSGTDSGLAAAAGGLVPGYASGGDLPANDTVRALLSPGEVVLPRSVINSDDAPSRAAAFVEAILRGRGRRAA